MTNCLKQRRKELGLSSAELCRRVGLYDSDYVSLETGRRSPMGAALNEWRLSARKLADFYNVEPAELFPGVTPKKPERLRRLDAPEFAELCMSNPPDAEEAIDTTQVWVATMEAFRRLTYLEQVVLIQRFGLEGYDEKTLDCVGQNIGRSRERTRQIEAGAIYRLRRQVEKLDPFVEGERAAAQRLAEERDAAWFAAVRRLHTGDGR